MPSLLLINPNTSAQVTALLRTQVQANAGPHVSVHAVTARFGAPYIACEASYAVAPHATLDAWASVIAHAVDRSARPSAVLIGCFGDPGLLALRDTSRAPVTGLAEGSFVEAGQHGRFAVVTGGARWEPMLRRLAQTLGCADALAWIETVAPTGAQLAADPEAARTLLADSCRRALARSDARSVIVGGAGLAGFAADLQRVVDAPLVDSVQAGARYALALARGGAAATLGEDRFDVVWQGLAAEMSTLDASRE